MNKGSEMPDALTLYEVAHIYPCCVITSNCTRNGICCCLGRRKESCKTRTRGATNTTSCAVVVRKENVICPWVASVPDRPKSLVEWCCNNSVLENDPMRVTIDIKRIEDDGSDDVLGEIYGK